MTIKKSSESRENLRGGATVAAGPGRTSTLTITAAPVITSFTPTGGPPGTVVTILGRNFVSVQSVTFGGQVANFRIVSTFEIQAIVPRGAVTGPIAVKTPAGTGRSISSFRVLSPPPPPPPDPQQPVITGFSPTSGFAGTTPVTIVGTNFDPNVIINVFFNGTVAQFSVVSSTEVDTIVPLGATTGPITFRTGIAPDPKSPSDFVVNTTSPHPPIYSGNGPIGGPPGTVVTIVGQYFINVEEVLFNGVSAQFTVSDSSHITATVPQGASTGYITVVTAAGTVQSNVPFQVTS